MCNKFLTELSIARLAIIPFKWAQDFNHYVPLMLHCLLQLKRMLPHMFSLKLMKSLYILNTFNTSSNRCTTSRIQPIPSANNDVIIIRCHISFRQMKKFGCICINKTLSNYIGIFEPYDMGLTPSRRLWETPIPRLVYTHSFACTYYSMWTAFGNTLQHCQTHQTLLSN